MSNAMTNKCECMKGEFYIGHSVEYRVESILIFIKNNIVHLVRAEAEIKHGHISGS